MTKIISKKKDWVLPSYEIVFEKKKYNSLLLIPVINEGIRLKRLINKIYDLKLNKFIDIGIVDGGSNDGSINIGNLKKKKINNLIIVNNNKGLGNQLICGFHYSIEKNYKYLIFIDGNDKDDPSSISKILIKLKQGYDFVQASRFIKGGYQKNTPILRLLAIRFIHAPILSFFSKFKWTDTTQGYRGYNTKLFLDRNIKPFRSIFQKYEILAYLSYRVPLLGYKCIEIPSKRIYPKKKNPTKISFFKGNIDLFLTLIKTCLGFYNPK